MAAAFSFLMSLGNSGDGGNEGIECDGDIIDSCDSGDSGASFGGHDGLRVKNDFSENFSFELFGVLKYSAFLRILHKGN